MMKRLFTMLCLCALLLASLILPAGAEQTAPTLISINVGKADCHLLLSGGTAYMIDTGTAESWGQVSAALQALEISHLDGVILTHTDKDHAGGLMALATSPIMVDAWYSSAFYTCKTKKHPARLAAQVCGAEVQWLQSGDTLPCEGGTLTVLGPTLADPNDKENNNSVVLRFDSSAGSMLLAGDMEFPEEELLLSAGLIAPATVLKVGNHANPDATSEALVQAVQPRLAVISTNTNEEPDTPAARVLAALSAQGAQVAVTQNAKNAVRVTLENGDAHAELLTFNPPEATRGMRLADKSVAQDAVTLVNDSDAAIDLSGWYLCSTRGGETFVLPAGTVLAPGAALTVTSLSSEDAGDLVWPEESVWHKSKSDIAQLYDAWGRLMSQLE